MSLLKHITVINVTYNYVDTNREFYFIFFAGKYRPIRVRWHYYNSKPQL